jgi:YesN/AraC family two-component response regulator
MTKKILLVDDEQFFLEGLQDGLNEFSDLFATDICFSVDQAIKLIRKNRYDLIVSDIRMPRKSGLDLFMYLRKIKYRGGFIAMTAYGTPEILQKVKKLGGLDIILKPFNFAWFKDRIFDYFTDEEGLSGTVNSIDLTSLLQMINLERKTLTVKIEAPSGTGYLDFKKGEIVSAVYGERKEIEAVRELIRLKKGRFSVHKAREDVEPNIDLSFMGLLMEASRQADEEQIRSKKPEKKAVKEDNMNVKKLNQAIEVQKDNMGEGLLATDIYGTADGQSVVGWNSNPQACALFNRITNYMVDALDGAGFPGLNRYYIMDLTDKKMVIVLNLGDFQWGMLVDRSKIQLGLLLNIAIPKMLTAFEDALKS